MISSIPRSWSILLQTVPGASGSLFLFILLTNPARAIIDVNSNGVSDLWEKNFNSGELLSNFDSQSDSDGDGWSGAEEAAAGTNPFDSNPPNGLIQLNIAHLQAVFGGPDENGTPTVISPEAITVNWPTLEGKQYTLSISTDLSEGSWIPVGDPFIGTGEDTLFAFVMNDEEKLFWRVTTSDVDSDSDTLTDAEEFELGTDPGLADTDYDGIADSLELDLNTSAVLWDSDGDGSGDGTEVSENKDPLSAVSFPPQWRYAERMLHYGYGNPNPESPPPYSKLRTFQLWDPIAMSLTDLAAEIPWPSLKGNLSSSYAFPPSPATPRRVGLGAWTIEGWQSRLGEPPKLAMLRDRRYWLVLDAPQSNAVTKGFLKILRRTIEGSAPTETAEYFETTVQPGDTTSLPVDICETLLTDPAFNAELPSQENLSISLLPLEITGKDKNPVSQLKVGKMSETGVITGSGASAALAIDKDSDQFFVQIKGGATVGGISLKVSTADNPEATYNDTATQIDLVADGEDAVSKSMLLVADEVDDHQPVDGIAEDAVGDRTHKLQLGGSFRIEEIKIGTQAWRTTGIKVSAPYEKTVHVKLVNCLYGIVSREPCWNSDEISFLKAVLKERYAQAGVELNFSEVAGPWIGFSGWLDPGEFPTDVVAGVLDVPQETKDIIDDGPAISPTEVAMYLVRRLDGTGISVFYGVALPPKYLSIANKSYGNKLLIGSMSAGYSGHFTGPHELLHILTDAKHGDFQTEFDDTKMLWHTPGSSTDTIDATKRISKNQVDKILLNTLAQ